ncbi:MAG: Ada metal-binding domain-containing protein [Chitinophagaceae bacterium]
MVAHSYISQRHLRKQIKNGVICYGGNIKLKIYGRLNCASGKRLKKMNRIFFHSLSEAIQQGYRPCGHCMKTEYKNWKDDIIRQ